jgi:hypothetical protein
MATATSVNKPVDVKQKDADVARKLQVYGIVTAFQHGKYPSVSAPRPKHHPWRRAPPLLTVPTPRTERPDRCRSEQLSRL